MPTDLKPIEKLPIRHQLFILGCLQHKGDKTKAARSAGYSPKTCVEQGYQLFIKLQDYIAPLTQELVDSHALRAEQVIQGLSLIAAADIGDYMKWDHKTNTVTLMPFEQLTPQQRYCIESVEQVQNQFGCTIKLRLAKKQPALDTLALYHNLLKRPVASKGLYVSFEDGTVHGGGKAQREGLEHTRRKVEVTFEDADVPTQNSSGPRSNRGSA